MDDLLIKTLPILVGTFIVTVTSYCVPDERKEWLKSKLSFYAGKVISIFGKAFKFLFKKKIEFSILIMAFFIIYLYYRENLFPNYFYKDNGPVESELIPKKSTPKIKIPKEEKEPKKQKIIVPSPENLKDDNEPADLINVNREINPIGFSGIVRGNCSISVNPFPKALSLPLGNYINEEIGYSIEECDKTSGYEVRLSSANNGYMRSNNENNFDRINYQISYGLYSTYLTKNETLVKNMRAKTSHSRQKVSIGIKIPAGSYSAGSYQDSVFFEITAK